MAATIIDSLLIELGLDPKGLSKGGKEATEQLRQLEKSSDKTGKAVEDAGKKMTQSIAKFRNELITVLTVFTAGTGLKQFFQQLTNADAATGRLAKNIDLSVDKLTAWQGVAERSGGSAEGIAGSMQGLTQQFQQLALTGQSSVVPFFRAVGVAISDAQGHLRPLDEILLDVSDKFSKMDPAKAQALGRGMGFDEGTVNVLMHGRAAIRDLLAEQERLGHANEADAKAAQQRQAAMRALAQASTDAGRKILTALTPALLDVFNLLVKIGEWFQVHPQAATAAVVTLTAAITALSAAMAIGMVASFARMAIAGVAAFGAIAASALPVITAIASVAGVGVAGAAGYGLGSWFSSIIDKGLSNTTNQETSLGSFLYDVTHGETKDIVAAMKRPRGIRNNNPGNLNFAGQAGATKETGPNGRFAVFGTMQEGLIALKNQLQLYAARGIDTIRTIISKFAPENENNTKAYIQAISKQLGIGANTKLNLSDPTTLKALMQGITNIEVGRGQVNPDLINAAVSSRGNAFGRSGNRVQSEVHIGQISVQTQANDANGIARDIAKPVTKYFDMAAMANYGLA